MEILARLPHDVIEMVIDHLGAIELVDMAEQISELEVCAGKIRPGNNSPNIGLTTVPLGEKWIESGHLMALERDVASTISRMHLVLTNRIHNFTYLGMYLLSELYYSKIPIQFVRNLEELLTVINVTNKYKMLANLTVSFYIGDFLDFHEFQEVISNLPKMNRQWIDIELEFDSGLQAVFQFDRILGFLAALEIALRIQSFTITNYQPILQDTKETTNINSSAGTRTVISAAKTTKPSQLFANLHTFWLINSKFKSLTKIEDDNNLINLKISPLDYGSMPSSTVLLKNLPVNLKILSLSHVVITSSSLLHPFPTKLQELKLSLVRDLTSGHFIYELVRHNISTLTTLCLDTLYSINGNYYQKLDQLIVENCHRFKEIFPLPNSQIFLNLKFGLRHLTLNPGDPMLFPHSLTKLSVINCNLTQVPNLPPNLIEVYLSHNLIDWTQYDRVSFPKHLKRLELKNTGLKSLKVLNLPSSLSTLALEVNRIESIDNVRFPDLLCSLGLGSNRIKSIKHHYLPPLLIILHLTENYITLGIDFTCNNDGIDLNIVSIYLNNNNIQSMEGFKFSSVTKVLNLDDNHISVLSDITFPKNLNEISFYGCQIKKIINVDFGNCDMLNLGNNSLTTLKNINFPHTLKELNLGYNKLSSIDPAKFKNTQIKRLNLSNNGFKLILKIILPESIRLLDCSSNQLHGIHILNDQEIVELQCLNLSNNKRLQWSQCTFKNINHQLCELDLSYTLERSSTSISPFTAQNLFIEWNGLEDELGYPIFTNLSQSCSIGKKGDI